MSVARNSFSRLPYYTYKEHSSFGNGLGGFRLHGAAASPSVAIVVGSYTNGVTTHTASGSLIKTSTDGVVWSNVETTSFGTNGITQLAYGNGVFVAMGGSNTIATSPGTSGTVWTQRTSPSAGTNAWRYLTFQNGIFVAMNTSTVSYNSTDGITWSSGATVSTSGLNSLDNPTSPRGGIFYIENNPSSARWLHVYGQNFATASTTHFAVYQDITSSGTISSTYANTNGGSRGPQWISEDNKLLVSIGSMTTAGFNGHASAINSRMETSSTSISGLPDTGVASGVFFPSVLPKVGQIQIGASTGSTVLLQYSQLSFINGNLSGTNTGKKAIYVYNDGYYNCLYVTDAIFGSNSGGVIAAPTMNVAFRADDPSYAESVQVIGSSTVAQAGVGSLASNHGARHGGFERAIQFSFKGNSYIFFASYDTDSYWTQGYLRGTRSIKPIRTTIGVGI